MLVLSGNVAMYLHFSEDAVPGQVPYWYDFWCSWLCQLLFLFLCQVSYTSVTFPGQPLACHTSAPLYSYCRPDSVPVSGVNSQCWTDVTLCVHCYVVFSIVLTYLTIKNINCVNLMCGW